MQHAAMIAVLILERPLCLDCISMKTGLGIREVDEYLTIISRGLALRREDDRCRACGEMVVVYSFTRPTN